MHTLQAEKAVIWREHFGEKLHAGEPTGERREPGPVPANFEVREEVKKERQIDSDRDR